MDDSLKVSTPDEAVTLRSELNASLVKGGFEVTKWTCNQQVVVDKIPMEDQTKIVREGSMDTPAEEKALGFF